MRCTKTLIRGGCDEGAIDPTLAPPGAQYCAVHLRVRRSTMRACFAELRVGMVLYALAHEKDLHYRPLRRLVGLPEKPSSGLEVSRENASSHALREIFDAIFFYVLKSGCPWRLLPGDFPPWQTLFYHLFPKVPPERLCGSWPSRPCVRPRGSATAKTSTLPRRSWTPRASRPRK